LGCASEELTNACYNACGQDGAGFCIISSAALPGVSAVLVLAAALLAFLH